MERQKHLSLTQIQASFPSFGKYRNGPWVGQEEIMSFVARNGGCLVESPTGTGKTAVEYAILRAAQQRGDRSLFLITPNKTILDQIAVEFPDLCVALGRNEHRCLYYKDDYGADEVACSMLRNCPHRVDQTTGETFGENVEPCPYLQQKYEAKQGGIVLCTMSFYLFTHLFTQEFGEPDVLVIDEVHRIADVVRGSLSYDITDLQLERSVTLLKDVEIEEWRDVRRFLSTMKRICKRNPPNEGVRLERKEIARLLNVVDRIDANALSEKIAAALSSGKIDAVADATTLKKLETLVRDVRRYVRSFEYSLPGDGRGPLNFTCAFYRREKTEGQKVQYRLTIEYHHVVPLIRKIMPEFTVSFSATIGNVETFEYESGIGGEVLSLESNFPANNTRIYMPTDTANLAVKSRKRRDMTQSIRWIARTCRRFSDAGHRSLVVTISNKEREKFIELATEEGVKVLSYGNGVTAKNAALMFKDGVADVLVGTAANYSEGIDLPRQLAPVIFFLRPGYPNPKDPRTQFETERFRNRVWAIWNWRVMIQALQVRGRNVRSRSDVGVTFFVSQQFRRFLFASLPMWLEKAYRGESTKDECVADALRLL